MSTTEQEKSNAEKLAAFKAEHGVQVIPASQQAAENAGTPAAAVQQTAPVIAVEPKRFPVAQFSQSGIQAFITVLTFRDVVDYTAYASDLYDVEDGKSAPDVEQTWQRTVSSSRVKGIGTYLKNDTHFLPPLLCVPASEESCKLETVDGKTVLTVAAEGLGVLDGQHRRGGILNVLMNGKGKQSNGQVDGLADESIPVVVMMLHDTDQRQQIFADVNRTPKLVSKALNLVFDHRDSIATLAKQIVASKNPQTGVQDLLSIVDMESLTPKKTSNHVMSLTNLYNMLSKFAGMKNQDESRMFSDELVTAIVRAVVDNLPDSSRIRKGTITYGLSRAEYLCYSSTAWQALGNVIRELALSKTPDGKPVYELADLPQVVANLIDGIDWRLTAPRWNETNRRVVLDGKVLTRTENVANCGNVIREALK